MANSVRDDLQIENSTWATAWVVIAILSAVLTLPSIAAASPKSGARTPKTEAVERLQEWRSRINDQDTKAQAAQRAHVVSLSKLSLKRDLTNDVSLEIAHRELETPLIEIENLDNERVELDARRRIVDQLIFTIDTKWSGADLKLFLIGTLLDLALNDLSDPGQGGWWRFLIHASISLRESAEPGADPIRFLEGYMAESGVLEPKSAIDFLKSRNYTGG